eukprot:1161596-Pelagomonas_calceolata.AAC.11
MGALIANTRSLCSCSCVALSAGLNRFKITHTTSLAQTTPYLSDTPPVITCVAKKPFKLNISLPRGHVQWPWTLWPWAYLGFEAPAFPRTCYLLYLGCIPLFAYYRKLNRISLPWV